MTARKTFFLLFLLPMCCWSQEIKKPLKDILDAMAQAHHIRFSYIDEELVVYTMAPPSDKLSLDAQLDFIEQRTRLQFKKVAPGYYTVYNNHKMDKPLCGFLADAQTGKPIENAQISIAGTPISLSSDAGGYFELPVLTPNQISIRHLSYEQKAIDPQDLYRPDCPKIMLTQIVQPLQEVVAERYLATGIAKGKSGDLIVSPRKFGTLPGLTEPDILQTMQQVPGIASTDETVSNINVRGGTHDQNLFLWNGVRMFQTGHFFGLMSAFNPLLASRITISKNGGSAFFGESVSSLVDISSYTSVRDSCYNVVAVDMLNANFFSKVRLSRNATLQGSGRRTFTDIFTSPTFRQYQDRVFQHTVATDLTQNQAARLDVDEDFYFYDFSLQYHQMIGQRHELIVDGIGIENGVGIDEETAAENKHSDLKQRNFGGSIDWRTSWNSRHRSQIQLHGSTYDLQSGNEAIANDQVTRQRNAVKNGGIRLRYSYIGERCEISAGYQFDAIAIENSDAVNNPPFSRTSNQKSVTHSAIAEGKFHSANGKRLLSAGVRANYFDKFGRWLIEPRLAFTQALSESIKMEILAERKSQTVSQIIEQQQDFLGIEKRRWVLANDSDVPIQKSTQASLGFTYAHRRWLVTVDNFYKRVGGITADSQGFRNQFEFANAVGEYCVMGSEVLVQKSFRRFYSWISYSYNNNHYDFNTLAPSDFTSNFEISHAVSWAGIYEWNSLRVAVGTKWHTGIPFTAPQTINADENNPANSTIAYQTPNDRRLGDYFQVSLSASRSWTIGGMLFAASGSVLNVLDRRNVIGRYYRINMATDALESVDTYSLGLTPNISLKLYF
jgi:hypothetical protein